MSFSKLIFNTFLSRLILMGLTFTTNIFISRILGPIGRGEFAIIITWGCILASITSLGMETSLVYFSSKESDAFRSLVRNSFIHSLYAGILVGGGLLLTNSYFKYPGLSIKAIFLLIILVPMTMQIQFMTSIQIGIGRLAQVNRIMIIVWSLYLIFVFIFSKITTLTSSHVVFAFTLFYGIGIAMMLLDTKRVTTENRFIPKIVWHDLFRYGMKSYLGNIAGLLRIRIQIVILAAIVSMAEVGKFSVAQSIIESLYIMPVIVGTVLMPTLAGNRELNPLRRTIDCGRFSFFTTLFFVIMLNMFSYLFVPLFFGESFRDSVELIYWLTPAILAYSVGKILVAYFNGIGKPYIPSGVEVITLIFLLITTWVLGLHYGATGAAISMSLSFLLYCGLLLLLFKRATESNLMDLFVMKQSDFILLVKMTSSLVPSCLKGKSSD